VLSAIVWRLLGLFSTKFFLLGCTAAALLQFDRRILVPSLGVWQTCTKRRDWRLPWQDVQASWAPKP